VTAIEDVRSLRGTWQGDKALQAALEAAFDEVGFDTLYVDSRITAAKAGVADRKTKHIKDNVWGMVELDGRAVRLLDCPVVQRLRGIKQLGFSYLTYPSAEHSRFIHSLGMACVVSRLLDSIKKRVEEQLGDDTYVAVTGLAPVDREDIVHAAILHDVGHMAFSHATEKALVGREDDFTCGNQTVGEILNSVYRRLSKKLRFSEILSLLVILSTRFSDFYDHYVRSGSEDPDALLRIACLIAGLAPVPRLSGVAELISASVVDADKIDYVSRDAHSCGIPVGLDVSRIFVRSGFLQADRDRLLASGLKENPAGDEVLFVVNASGLDTVDEITQARAALYQRVYLHGVTRTAEAIYSGALEANALATNKDAKWADAIGLWAVSDNVLLPALAASQIPEVKMRGRKLRDRELPKKACVFNSSIATMHMPLEQLFPKLNRQEAGTLRKQVVNTPLENLTAEKVLSGIGRQLVAEIRKELEILVTKVPPERRKDLVPDTPIELLEFIGSAYMDQVQMDCIVLQNGELLRTSQFTKIREQRDAFDIFKAVGFVMCDPAWRPLVTVAARSVLCKPRDGPKETALFEMRLGYKGTDGPYEPDQVFFVPRMILDIDGVIRRAGVNRSRANAIIEAITESGYFDDKPLLARPIDSGQTLIRSVARKLAKFEGQRSWQVTQESVAAFANQFPPSLREPLLRLLDDELIFFDRAEIRSSLSEKINEIGPGDVVALTPNSGTLTRALLEEEMTSRAGIRFHKELATAISKETTDPIIFVDDNISSATLRGLQSAMPLDCPRKT
jgi:HD superfamily phosphohydrolase